jgi:hypothetical protein
MSLQRLLPALLCLPALAVLAPTAVAADAHVGVHPKRGEMVLLRDVSARHAVRQAPPGIALIVDPTPRREINQALGTGELSDEDFASLSSGQQLHGDHQAMPARMTQQALAGVLGQGSGGQARGAMAGSGTGALRGSMDSLGQTTRGIGSQVTGALNQLPFSGGDGSRP